MRKSLIIPILVLLTLCFSSIAQAAPRVILDGQALSFDVPPTIENGRTLVPLRVIFEALGADVQWDGSTQNITATKDGNEIQLIIGGKAFKNGQEVPLDVPAKLINNRTVVPLRFVSEALGCKVDWEGANQRIYISTKGEDSELAKQEQLPQMKTWVKTITTSGFNVLHCVQQTKDGGYILTGHNKGDLYLIKLDILGNVQWEKTYAGSMRVNIGYCVQQTSDNGYIIVGITRPVVIRDSTGHNIIFGVGNFFVNDQIGTNTDALVLKTDENGVMQWIKTFGKQEKWINESATSVVATKDGGCIFVGEKDYEVGKSKAWMVKLDGKGMIQWEKTYGHNISNKFNSIKQVSSGGYILAGSTSTENINSELKDDFYVVRVNEQGDIEWERTCGGNLYDYANAVQPASDGGFVIAGKIQSFGTGEDMNALVVKLDYDGEIEWQKTYGDTGNEIANSIIETGEGDFVVVGAIDHGITTNYYRKAYLVKLDSKGNILSEIVYNSQTTDWLNSIGLCYDGGYVLCGYKNYGENENNVIQAFIIKTDASGKGI
ncbi:MAG: hypothetical protein A4E53_02640 [Pelotomaculum sp. PtaB.Bin104]|nr:MAG: hypothetical protein A4E53_02640 [Pelotomaculum sp. PtaB.Bin104]